MLEYWLKSIANVLDNGWNVWNLSYIYPRKWFFIYAFHKKNIMQIPYILSFQNEIFRKGKQTFMICQT